MPRPGRKPSPSRGTPTGVHSVAFSPDGKRLASASDDGTVKVWDAGTGQEILTLKGHTDRVDSVAFSPDGKRLASASADGTVKVWDAGTGQEDPHPQGAHQHVRSVAFSPDGKRLASASQDQTVKVWDAATGQETLTLKGHTDSVDKRGVQPRRLAARLCQCRQDGEGVGRPAAGHEPGETGPTPR